MQVIRYAGNDAPCDVEIDWEKEFAEFIQVIHSSETDDIAVFAISAKDDSSWLVSVEAGSAQYIRYWGVGALGKHRALLAAHELRAHLAEIFTLGAECDDRKEIRDALKGIQLELDQLSGLGEIHDIIKEGATAVHAVLGDIKEAIDLGH